MTRELEARLHDLDEISERPLMDIVGEIKKNLELSQRQDTLGIGDFTIPARLLWRLIEEIEYEDRQRIRP